MAQISDDAAARRLVQRFGFGPARGASVTGFDATLARLTGPANDPGAAATPPPTFPPAERRAKTKNDPAARKQQGQAVADQTRQLATWWLDRMVAVQQPFPEKLTWFWHSHFATSVQKVKQPTLMYVQNDTQRRLGGGDFRQLARAMIVDPAMLVWLDGTGNRVGRPNENLAREFMELFTLGVGNYTEDDVKQAARALTGWGIDLTTGTSSMTARLHDPGPETVLGTTASFDAPSFADMVVDLPVSPEYVVARVWKRFVSDTPPSPATQAALLAAYGPGHDVTALMKAAAASPEFRDDSSALVRQPVEWLVASLKALNTTASTVPAPKLAAGMTSLGQVPFRPPDVGGWPAGTPWLTTASALARRTFAQELVTVGDISPVADVPATSRVDATAELLGLAPFTPRTVAALQPLAGTPPQLVATALASPEMAVSV